MEAQANEETTKPASRRGLWAVLGTAAAIAIFLAGFIPATLRSRQTLVDLREQSAQTTKLQEDLARTQYDLEVSRLRGDLGNVLYESNVNNYGIAAKHATEFFDALRAALNRPQLPPVSDRRVVLDSILARRDEISADLAKADPVVKDKLSAMYMEFAKATRD
ncbi:MAG: hypothetical protein ABI718_11655 [Acidobacteriota bacterium]